MFLWPTPRLLICCPRQTVSQTRFHARILLGFVFSIPCCSREVSWQGQYSILHVREIACLRTISWGLLVFCGWVGLRCSIFILAAEAHLLLDGPIRQSFQDSWQYRDSPLRHKFLARILRTTGAHGISKLASRACMGVVLTPPFCWQI